MSIGAPPPHTDLGAVASDFRVSFPSNLSKARNGQENHQHSKQNLQPDNKDRANPIFLHPFALTAEEKSPSPPDTAANGPWTRCKKRYQEGRVTTRLEKVSKQQEQGPGYCMP